METRAETSGAAGIVLAGGRSSRMGQPKGLLPFDNEPLIAHIVGQLRQLFGEVIVVAAPGQDLPALPATLVRDEVAYQGPVGGIRYGLAAARSDVAFVTSCDSVFLSPALVSHLVSRIAGYDVVVPHWQGRFQPLQAVYRKSVLPLLERQLAAGELRPAHLFDKVRTCRVDEDEIRRFDPSGASFFNMNTPADYAEACERWNAARGRELASGERIHCTVELFGVARLVSGIREVPLVLRAPATFADVFAELAARVPALAGRVITPDGQALVDGYACNVDGREFVRSAAASVNPGDTIVILSADAGG